METNQTEKSQAELYREERKQRMAKESGKKAKKSPQAAKIGKIVSKVISIVIVAAIVIGALAGVLNFFGVPQKVLTSVKYGSTKVSVAKYNFYYMSIYNNVSQTAKQYDQYYGTGAGLQYTGYDYSKTPMEQEYTAGNLDIESDKTPTWADYLRISTVSNIQQYVAYSALAREAGITLTEDEQKTIDDQIEELRTTAKDNDYSLDRFLMTQYGKGASEKMMREIMEEQTLASNYAKQKQAEVTKNVTDEQIDEEFSKNINNYTILSVSAFKVSAEKTNVADNATDEEKTAATNEAMAKAKTKAETYAASVKNAADLLIQAKAYNSSATDSSVVYNDTSYSTLNSSFGATVADWAVSSDRAPGNVAVLETTDGYVVIHMTAVAHKNEVKPVNVRHILIQFPTDESGNAKTLTDDEKQTYYAKAKAIYDEYLANPVEENFATLATNNSEDTGSSTNGGLYETVKPGDMVTAFNDWCFDASRKTGDTGIIETQYGYHVMYYVDNNNEEVWKSSVRAALAESAYTSFDDELLADDGKYAKKQKDAIINWSARQMEKLIQKQYINYNNK